MSTTHMVLHFYNVRRAISQPALSPADCCLFSIIWIDSSSSKYKRDLSLLQIWKTNLLSIKNTLKNRELIQQDTKNLELTRRHYSFTWVFSTNVQIVKSLHGYHYTNSNVSYYCANDNESTYYSGSSWSSTHSAPQEVVRVVPVVDPKDSAEKHNATVVFG